MSEIIINLVKFRVLPVIIWKHKCNNFMFAYNYYLLFLTFFNERVRVERMTDTVIICVAPQEQLRERRFRRRKNHVDGEDGRFPASAGRGDHFGRPRVRLFHSHFQVVVSRVSCNTHAHMAPHLSNRTLL